MDIPNCVLTGVIIVLAISLACFLINLKTQKDAPEGYEDETGFHLGRKEHK